MSARHVRPLVSALLLQAVTGGCDRIMFAFYETLIKCPRVAAVLKEELR